MIANILPHFPQSFVWVFSRKYIAGKKLDEAIQCIEKLHKEKNLSTVDVLGESVTTTEEVEFYKEAYLHTIETLSEYDYGMSVSLKPTMFGLLIDEGLCYSSIRTIISLAASRDLFVRIDMEDSSCTDAEMRLFEKLYQEFPAHVGIVLQAYLKRTLSDLDKLKKVEIADHPINIRLCKGIYIEPKEIAYKRKQEVRDSFTDCLEKMLEYKFYPALATHDKKLINSCLELLKKYSLKSEEYEFQMLLGVTPRLRRKLIASGHKMRVYVPFGSQWFLYATRRLQENPHMVWDIIAGLVLPK